VVHEKNKAVATLADENMTEKEEFKETKQVSEMIKSLVFLL